MSRCREPAEPFRRNPARSRFPVPFIEIDQQKYFYQTAGCDDPKAPRLVFLHGSGGDSTVWHCQIPWTGRHRVLMPDLPGHGKSGGSGCVTVEEYGWWLDRFAAAVAYPSFVLAGFSLGGLIAQWFALTFPEKVRGVILISTGMRVRIAPEFLQLVKQDFPAAAKASCDSAYTAAALPELYQQGLSMLLGNGAEIYYTDIMMCDRFDSSAWLHRLACPALVVCGDRDPITPPELSRAMAGRLPRAELSIVRNAAHMVMQEQPEQFYHLVKNFIERIIPEA